MSIAELRILAKIIQGTNTFLQPIARHIEGRSTGVHNLSKRFYSDSSQIPTNMKMFDAAERSATITESTREVYESNRVDQSTTNGNIIISVSSDTSDSNRYDVAGNAQMTPALQSHVPEPFAANDTGNNLKEGMPEGLGGQQRWSMGDRMDVGRTE